jgi:hypothetical protein
VTVTVTLVVFDRLPLVPVTVIVYVFAGVPGFPPPLLDPPPPQPMRAPATSAAASNPNANFNRRLFVEIARRRSRLRSTAAPPVTNQFGPEIGTTAEGAVVVIVSIVVPLDVGLGLNMQPGGSETTGVTMQLNETAPENPLTGEIVIVEVADPPGGIELGLAVVADKLKLAAAVTVTVVGAERAEAA